MILGYSEKQLEFMSKEMGLPISKVIMILDNPPDKIKPCEDCKEKEKEE